MEYRKFGRYNLNAFSSDKELQKAREDATKLDLLYQIDEELKLKLQRK